MSDDQLLAYIAAHPGVRLMWMCYELDIPWRPMPAYRSPARSDCGYTPQAKALRNQLQRLRRGRKLRSTQGQGWEVREQ